MSTLDLTPVQVAAQETDRAARAVSGTGAEQPLEAVAAALEGNWSSAALNAAGAGAAYVLARRDPVGAAPAAGVAWMVDHLDPLRTWADDLTGDPDAVAHRARLLRSLAGELSELAADLRGDAGTVLDDQHGDTIGSYRLALLAEARRTHQAGRALGALADALEQASVLVEAVRSFVVGLVSEVVGRFLARGVLVATGVGGTVVLGALTSDVAAGVRRARRVLDLLIGCLEVLRSHLRHLVAELAGIVSSVARRQVRPRPRHRGEPTESLTGRLAGVALAPAVATGVDAADRDAKNHRPPVWSTA